MKHTMKISIEFIVITMPILLKHKQFLLKSGHSFIARPCDLGPGRTVHRRDNIGDPGIKCNE